jgi:ABC-2 type transport system ATP-binding protein
MSFTARDVTVELAGTVALRDIDVDVRPGSITAVVGGDGAGKTTLLRCFAGEMRPTRGTVTVPEKSRLGYLPSTSGTWRDLTVDEHLDLIARVFRVDRSTMPERRTRLLDQAGLVDARDRLAGDLSGGMRKKLGFCLAILHDPVLLVLDEASTGVDAVSRLELWQLIADAAARGAAVLMATTYLDEAERAERVLVLDDGVPLALGAPEAIVAEHAERIVETDRPRDARLAWRRGRTFHEWRPTGDLDGARLADADLEDAVISAILNRARRDGDEGRA